MVGAKATTGPFVRPELRPSVLEPGRAIVGYSGALIGRVVDTKCFPDGRKFAVLDAGMSELIRPALYGSFHRIVPVVPRNGSDSAWDVVGPICESGDYFCKDRPLPKVNEGDHLALLSAGAYGFVMASNYNSRAQAAEVLVNGNKAALVRERQPLHKIWEGESIPAWLQ